MFTGIIEAVGEIRALESRGGDLRMVIATGDLAMGDVQLGDSIAASGVCLTAVAFTADSFTADVSGETVSVEKRYPSGHPEILMARVTGRYGLDEGRPRQDIHVINAETAMAVCRAVREGLPVIDKAVTVGQEGAMPVVMRVPLGTPFVQVLEKTGLLAEDADRLFSGGPWRGVAHFDPEGPITKGTDGLFLQKGRQVFRYEDVACIGCGQCVKVCPMKIPVNMMTRNCEFVRIEEALSYDLGSCVECGLCAYVCTARRPLLQYIQFAKKEHEKAERERQSA